MLVLVPKPRARKAIGLESNSGERRVRGREWQWACKHVYSKRVRIPRIYELKVLGRFCCLLPTAYYDLPPVFVFDQNPPPPPNGLLLLLLLEPKPPPLPNPPLLNDIATGGVLIGICVGTADARSSIFEGQARGATYRPPAGLSGERRSAPILDGCASEGDARKLKFETGMEEPGVKSAAMGKDVETGREVKLWQ